MTSERARHRAWESLDPSMFLLEDPVNRPVLWRSFGLQVQLLFDSPIASHTIPSFDAISRWYKYITSNKYFDVMTKLSTIALDIHNDRLNLSLTKSRDVEFWKALPIKEELFGLLTAWTPELHRFVLSFLLFCKKILYEDEALKEQATVKWLALDESLPSDFYTSDLDATSVVFKRLVRDFNLELDNLRFSHGPGSTSDSSGRILQFKHETLKGVPCFELFLYRRFRGQTGRVAHASLLDAVPHHLDMAPEKQRVRWRSNMSVHCVSLIRHVRKDHKGPRTICMESTPMMYAQQAIFRQLDVQISKHLGHYIDLHSQDRNKNLARIGSIDGCYSTIDLSSASDSVSFELVRYLCQGTQLEGLLLSLTSGRTRLPDGREVKTKKFAPMGSALCFPVQCLVFLSIVLSVYMRYVPLDQLVEGVTSPFLPPSIFGDDIIVDTSLYSEVIDSLISLGFLPNYEKSFDSRTNFKESCGGWYYRGYDVTPYFLQLKETRLRDTNHSIPYSLTSFASAINRANEFGFYKLRLSLISILMRSFTIRSTYKTIHYPTIGLFDESDGLSIRTEKPRNLIVRKYGGPRTISYSSVKVYKLIVRVRPSGRHIRNKYYSVPACLVGADETGRLQDWLYHASHRFNPMTDMFNDLRDNVIYSPACVGWEDLRPTPGYKPQPDTLRRIVWKWMPG